MTSYKDTRPIISGRVWVNVLLCVLCYSGFGLVGLYWPSNLPAGLIGQILTLGVLLLAGFGFQLQALALWKEKHSALPKVVQ